MTTDLPKQYDPQDAQALAAFWLEKGYFHADPTQRASRTASSSRRRTSPARCTWATRSTTRSRTS